MNMVEAKQEESSVKDKARFETLEGKEHMLSSPDRLLHVLDGLPGVYREMATREPRDAKVLEKLAARAEKQATQFRERVDDWVVKYGDMKVALDLEGAEVKDTTRVVTQLTLPQGSPDLGILRELKDLAGLVKYEPIIDNKVTVGAADLWEQAQMGTVAKKAQLEGIQWALRELHVLLPEATLDTLWTMRFPKPARELSKFKENRIWTEKLTPYFDTFLGKVTRGVAGQVPDAKGIFIDIAKGDPFFRVGLSDKAIADAIDARLKLSPSSAEPSTSAPLK